MESSSMKDDGWKSVAKENPAFKCRKCKSNNIFYMLQESYDGAHDDYKYNCRNCLTTWWAEGSDY